MLFLYAKTIHEITSLDALIAFVAAKIDRAPRKLLRSFEVLICKFEPET